MGQITKLSFMTAFVLTSAIGLTFGDSSSDFGKRIAGTYLSNTVDDALIIQLASDGSMTGILSEQFLNLGVVGESFSDTLGTWKRVGYRTILVTSVDVAFEKDVFLGVAAARYVIHFDRHFRRAKLNCTGAIYPPGVDPFSKDAEPIDDSEFECNEYFLKRLP